MIFTWKPATGQNMYYIFKYSVLISLNSNEYGIAFPTQIT